MTKKPPVAAPERTPYARLSEAGMHPILGYQLAQAGVVTTQVFDGLVRSRHELRRGEFTLLTLVHGNPGVTARQLARALGVKPPNVALWVDRLQALGLLTRERGDSDARVQHLRTTARGAALVDRLVKDLVAAERAALSTLSPAEHAMLVELLHKAALARGRMDSGP